MNKIRRGVKPAVKKQVVLLVFFLLTAGILAVIDRCDRQQAWLTFLKERNEQLKTELEGRHERAARSAVSAAQLVMRARPHIDEKNHSGAAALLETVIWEFPDSPESDYARSLSEELERVRAAENMRQASETTPRPIFSGSQGYLTFIGAAGGQAGASSISAELNRIQGGWLYGGGLAWLRTTQVKNIYYVTRPGSSGTTDLGSHNEGDEYEIYGVAGRKITERFITAASLGLSRQDIVNLEQSNTTGTLYVTSRSRDIYLTFSGQIRYLTKNNLMFVLGYHTRRGALAGAGLKW